MHRAYELIGKGEMLPVIQPREIRVDWDILLCNPTYRCLQWRSCMMEC